MRKGIKFPPVEILTGETEGIVLSIWTKDYEIPEREPLRGDYAVDVAVVGAGMAGILIARLLQEKGLDCAVFDSDRIGGGNTAGTTAKITSQHDLFYHELMVKVGERQAAEYAEANQKAIEEFARLAEGVDCDFHRCPAYVYNINNTNNLEHELRAVQHLGIQAEIVAQTELPFPVAGALRFDNQARFHPLKFLRAISQDLQVYEKTRVQGVEDDRVITEHGTVQAKAVVIATHFPFINVPGYYFVRMHQERSYVIALQNAAAMDGMYIDECPDGLSFRQQNEFLLLGGGSHRSGMNAGGKYAELSKQAQKLYPSAQEVTRWSAQDCISQDKIPFIGHYSKRTPNLYVASGFKKWGMTGSMVAAMILSAKMTGQATPFEETFDPARIHFDAAKAQIVNDVREITKAFAERFRSAPEISLEKLPSGTAQIIEHEGEKCGVYRDQSGKLFWVDTRCPHLGCELSWNPDELSWDCPCHGSRFHYNGKRIDGPAEVDISIEGFNA